MNEDTPLYEIAAAIRKDWTNVYFGARPYLTAMATMDKVTDYYGLEPGKSIINYFLGNAKTWRGPVSRDVKKLLRNMSK